LALLWLAKVFSANVVESLIPAVQFEITALDNNILILSLGLNRGGTRATLRLRANLLRPLYYEGRMIYPIPESQGWYQIDINAQGLLLSMLIFLSAILGWPQRNAREMFLRAVIAIPVLALLFALDIPLQLLGNFQQALIRNVVPLATRPLYAWDIFLDGGGSAALALVLACCAISAAAALSSRASRDALPARHPRQV
jgi:hypothetical protein